MIQSAFKSLESFCSLSVDYDSIMKTLDIQMDKTLTVLQRCEYIETQFIRLASKTLPRLNTIENIKYNWFLSTGSYVTYVHISDMELIII
ncbi:6950_t:CDS:2 [Funneliformis mosseae]|uniref:6950_t:CDS:1 n=1 Tax=Funneliformis mosseae TaxID=27381 RepID=A0A9N8Z090_FUNMO|nr:6950_t:CDS:2 [Funneliformis mosseae]